MKGFLQTESNIGRYKGMVAEKYRDPGFLNELECLKEMIDAAGGQVLSAGRNLNVRISIKGHDLAIKSFGCQRFLKDHIDSIRGTKARRTWNVASVLSRAGAGITPFPVAFLECWSGGRLRESYYISEYQDHAPSFKDELIRLFAEDPDCSKFMNLLESVAAGIRKMHRAGVQHNDLGNQNILLRRDGANAWKDVQFIDLNRASIRKELSTVAKARDISRIYLPSDLFRVFKEMYYGGRIPTESFHRWERFFRRLYSVHCSTRKIRHPLRTIKAKRGVVEEAGEYPQDKDMWIWDERSGQTINAFVSRDRNRYYPGKQICQIAGAVAGGASSVWTEYKTLLDGCWTEPVAMKNRIGLAIEPQSAFADLELAILNKMGNLPVIIRFYRHKGPRQWDFTAGIVRRLHKAGRSVTAVLVQDRASVKDVGLWREFTDYVLGKIASDVDMVEFGHAINRVKWGIWSFDEYRGLAEVMVDVAKKYPSVKFVGPAVIDFEYPFLMGVLKSVPAGLKFGALSHHLYVDRRGAPENYQGRFSTLEKLVLARAIARWSGCCEDRLIVSEVNWPLKGTGVYSPVGSPYESPQPRTGDPSVSEEEYGEYMLRYLVTAICSGMAERVYWWRLVARGYGLIDDTDSEGWRERPAYAMLEHFIRLLGTSVFKGRMEYGRGNTEDGIRKREDGRGKREGVVFLGFELSSGRRVCMAYSHGGDIEVDLPFETDGGVDVFGVKLKLNGERVSLTGRPIYLNIKP